MTYLPTYLLLFLLWYGSQRSESKSMGETETTWRTRDVICERDSLPAQIRRKSRDNEHNCRNKINKVKPKRKQTKSERQKTPEQKLRAGRGTEKDRGERSF